MTAQKLNLDLPKLLSKFDPVPRSENEVVEYEIDENGVVTLWVTDRDGESRLFAMMSEETFEALRTPNEFSGS